MTVTITEVTRTDLADVADVAARTFPLACPASATTDNIAAFIAENLSQSSFAGYLADPDRVLLLARDGSRAVGYAMLVRGVPDDDGVRRAVTLRPAVELSKMYALPDVHGAGVAAALMSEALARAAASDAKCVWLGVNQLNLRAQRFYAKHGFTIGGTKTFRLGAAVEHDYVLVRPA